VRTRRSRPSALLAVILVVAACGSSPTPSLAPNGSLAVGSPEPTAAPSVPTSETLIADALAKGSITKEQSLVDRALALYDSPGLPSQFKSPIADMEAAGNLLRDIDAAAASLSADTLAKLAPYRARPNDPVSIFNNPPARAQVGGMAAAAIVPGIQVDAVTLADPAPVWKSLPAAGGKARVWVADSAVADADLAEYADQVSKVWAAFPRIFTYPEPDHAKEPSAAINPDSAIDLYFVNRGALDPRDDLCAGAPAGRACALEPRVSGFTPRIAPFHDNKSSAYIVLDAAAPRDKSIDTIAHELAHAAQFAYDYGESAWLMESTATWVAYQVDLKLGIKPADQYAWLPQLFGTLDKTLTRGTDDNEYPSWLYIQFASMEQGNGVVTKIWKAAAADGEQGYKAVDQVFAFKDHYADYALRDWNQDPIKPMYKSVDGDFPDREPKLRNSVKTLAGGKKDILNVNLPPLAAAYYEYDFPASVQDVTFDNYLQGYADARVWAIKKIGDVWQKPEDWSNAAKKKLCLNFPEDNVKSIILIVSDVSPTADLQVPDGPKMTAGITGCGGWRGTMTGTAGWTNEGYTGTSHATFTGVWMVDETGDAGCNPTDGSGCVLYRAAGTIAWAFQGDHPAGIYACHVATSGSKAAGLETHDDQQEFYLLPKDQDHLQYWGRGYFEWPKTTCTPPMPSQSLPIFFDIYDNYSSSIQAANGNTCSSTDWIISAKADTIDGKCDDFVVPQGWLKYEWHLTRVGPKPAS